MLNPPSGPKKTLLMKPRGQEQREMAPGRRKGVLGILQGAGPGSLFHWTLRMWWLHEWLMLERRIAQLACRDISDFILAF